MPELPTDLLAWLVTALLALVTALVGLLVKVVCQARNELHRWTLNNTRRITSLERMVATISGRCAALHQHGSFDP